MKRRKGGALKSHSFVMNAESPIHGTSCQKLLFRPVNRVEGEGEERGGDRMKEGE